MIIPFGKYFLQTVERVGDDDEGLLYLDEIVDQCESGLKEYIKEYLKKNAHRLDAALANKRDYKKRPADPIPAPWWEKK